VSDTTTLRDLRVWHYRRMVSARTQARRAEQRGSRIVARNAHNTANAHRRFLSVLNDLFPRGDSAIADLKSTRAQRQAAYDK
jgi:hypothetical protein